MSRNLFSSWGRFTSITPDAGKEFIVAPTGTATYADLLEMYPTDEDGVPRIYNTPTAALAACVSNRGDSIYLTPDYVTPLTAAELLSAETKNVDVTTIIGPYEAMIGSNATYRATATLPQSTASAIFTVTGRVQIVSIIGTVMTAIQAQANATKLKMVPTLAALATTDLCATGDINGLAVGLTLGITGTLATALSVTTASAKIAQTTPINLEAGTIQLDCAASNTGSVKWATRWIPIDPGARVIAA